MDLLFSTVKVSPEKVDHQGHDILDFEYFGSLSEESELSETDESVNEESNSDESSYEDTEFEFFDLLECYYSASKDEDLQKFLTGTGDGKNIEVDEDGNSVLHIAAKGDKPGRFEMLVTLFSDKISATNNKKRTPLHIAAKNNQSVIAEKLIKRKANIHIKDVNRFTPILTAVRYDSLEVFELLLDEMKSVDDKEYQHFLDGVTDDNTKNPPLTALQIATKFNSQKVAEKLIKTGVSLYVFYKNKYNLVHIATENKSADVLQILLNCKTNSDFVNGIVPEDSVQAHLSERASDDNNVWDYVEITDSESKDTALKKTLLRVVKQKKILKYFNETTSEDHTVGDDPEEMESDDHNVETSHLDDKEITDSKSKGTEHKKTPLHVAAQKGYLECLNILIQTKQADLYRKCENGKTALHLAAAKGRIGVVERLFKEAPKLKYVKDRLKRTALHDAINHMKVVEILITSGAKINARDKSGRTPLSYAAEKGQIECTIKLIENGADVNLGDKNQMRPIHFAAREGQAEVFRKLATTKGIDLDQSDLNCLDLAIDNNHIETVLTIFQIEDSNWRKMLQSRSKMNNSNEFYDTPMRKLIRQMPVVLTLRQLDRD